MIYLVFIALCAVITSVRGTCPANAIQQAMLCTAKLGKGPPSSGDHGEFIDLQQTERVIRACRNGDLFTAVNCIERVKEECKNDNTDAAHYLNMMIDVEKTRKTIKYLCTYIAEYATQADCMQRHHKEQLECAGPALHTFKTQMSATSNMDTLMIFQCQYQNKVKECAEQVLSEKCSEGIADIVKTVLEGLTPPQCDTDGIKAERKGGYDIENENGNGNTSTRYSCSLLMVILNFCFILMLLL